MLGTLIFALGAAIGAIFRPIILVSGFFLPPACGHKLEGQERMDLISAGSRGTKIAILGALGSLRCSFRQYQGMRGAS